MTFFTHQHAPEAIKALKKIASAGVASQDALQGIATKLSQASGHTIAWQTLTDNNVPQQVLASLPKGTTIHSMQQLAAMPDNWRNLTNATCQLQSCHRYHMGRRFTAYTQWPFQALLAKQPSSNQCGCCLAST